jgi:hypothetical protein
MAQQPQKPTLEERLRERQKANEQQFLEELRHSTDIEELTAASRLYVTLYLDHDEDGEEEEDVDLEALYTATDLMRRVEYLSRKQKAATASDKHAALN